ncbi:MAG: GTP 3',8-cyclase MoaA [Thermodesulfobacteriota bacterium]
MNTRLTDTHARTVTYLRVSITDRCNLNCVYCNPSRYAKKLPHDAILSYEELLRVIRAGAEMGITKVRVTGGEPLVRRDACRFLSRVAALPGVTDLSLTTNGVLLADCVHRIREAGIGRINISLDTLDRRRFKTITGHDCFDRVWAGVTAALDAGFSPVKLNMVVMPGVNDDELEDFAGLAGRWPLHVRFIEQMPVKDHMQDFAEPLLAPEIQRRIAERVGALVPVGGTGDGTTARRFTFDGAKGELGFINPVSRHFCGTCNRLRLTADGKLRPCLMADRALDIRGPLRGGASDETIRLLLREVVLQKPACHGDSADRGFQLPRQMWSIGG